MGFNDKKKEVIRHRRRLDEMEPGDRYYVGRTENGFGTTYLCEFARLDRGIVEGGIVKAWPSYADQSGMLRVRKTSCYLLFPPDPPIVSLLEDEIAGWEDGAHEEFISGLRHAIEIARQMPSRQQHPHCHWFETETGGWGK